MKRIFLWAALLCSSLSYAQQDSTILNEVIVTATRFEQKKQTTGKVVTVIDRTMIEANAGKTLSQLLNDQAGIIINGAISAQGSPQSVYMRGASSGRASILIDGIPVYDPSMINNEFDPALIPLQSIQRIEVCKGAQSSLYGSDAIAGVINIITIPQQVTKPLQGSILTATGNRAANLFSFNAYGKIERLKYAIDLSHNSTDGFSTAIDTVANKSFDKDGFRQRAINTSISYEINKRLTANGFVRNTHYTAATDEKAFTDDKDFTAKNKYTSAGIGLHYNHNNTQLHYNISFNAIQRDYVNDSVDAPSFVTYSNNHYKGKSLFTECYGTQKLSATLKLVYGVDFRKYTMSQAYLSASGWGPYSSTFNDSSLNQLSVFSTLFSTFANGKINIEAGSRFNANSMYGNSFTYTLNPSWLLTSEWKIFASMATGFKAPTIYQVYDAYSGNKNLEAEQSFSTEAGVHYQNKIMATRLVFFDRKINNGIDYNYATYKYFNFNKQHVSGIELECQYEPIRAVRLLVNYTVLKTSEQTQSRLTQKETTYPYLLRRPKDAVNISITVLPVKKVMIDVQAKYVSKRYDTGGFMQNDVVLKKYMLINSSVTLNAWKYISLFAQAQNLFNKNFSEVHGYTGMPFTIMAGIKVQVMPNK